MNCGGLCYSVDRGFIVYIVPFRRSYVPGTRYQVIVTCGWLRSARFTVNSASETAHNMAGLEAGPARCFLAQSPCEKRLNK